MALTDTQTAFCREWCEKHVTTWQVLKKGEWTYRWHGKTLVRYVDAVQVRTDEMSALIEYLASDACIETLSLAKQGISGEWKPVSAWYERNEKPNGAIGGVRLFHALMVHPENGGDGPYVVENGCMWNVRWTFYWKQQSVAALPASSSGINYRITNLTRDDEDGTFSYVLERRERVQQDIAEYTTAKTTFETRKEEQHLGVKQGSVAGTGKAASVSNGKMVRRQLRKNEDCTSDVINETVEEQSASGAITETEARLRGTVTTTVNRNMPDKASESGLAVGTSVRNEKTDGGRWTQTIRTFVSGVTGIVRSVCRKTIFRHTHAETTVEADDPGFTHVQEAGGGVVVEKDVQKNDYGSYDVVETTMVDMPAPSAMTETRAYIDGTVTTVVNRNQPEKASEDALDVGDSVRNEKTESGVWDQTIVKAFAVPSGGIEESCQHTALVHGHSTTTGIGRQSSVPSVEIGGVVDGVAKTVHARKTERGAWNVTEETRTAIPKSTTVVGGSAGHSTSAQVFRNAVSLPSGAGGVNLEVDASCSINEFGLVDGTSRTVTYHPNVQTGTASDAGKTVVVTSGNNAAGGQSASGGANVDADISISPNDHGSASYTCRIVTHNPNVQMASVSNPTYSENIIAGNNSFSVQNPAGTVADVSISPNEHGTMSFNARGRTPVALSNTWTWQTNDNNYTYTHTLVVFKNQSGVNPGNGNYQTSVSVNINEYGLYDGYIHSVDRDGDGGGGSGDGGMAYSGTIVVHTKTGRRVTVPFSTYRNDRGSVSSGFLNGAHNYPEWGLASHDNGKYGIKYGQAY